MLETATWQHVEVTLSLLGLKTFDSSDPRAPCVRHKLQRDKLARNKCDIPTYLKRKSRELDINIFSSGEEFELLGRIILQLLQVAVARSMFQCQRVFCSLHPPGKGACRNWKWWFDVNFQNPVFRLHDGYLFFFFAPKFHIKDPWTFLSEV